jgi:exodeoxyribonuclease III
MALKVTTWNINSVRLRIDLVGRLVDEQAPDILCLQETKCPDAEFPLAAVKAMGFAHVAFAGEKGYNGVAIFSRLPFVATERFSFGGKPDTRHIAGTVERAGRAITVHNFYIPAGGDIADPAANPKFAHKLAYLADLERWCGEARATRGDAILVGDLNIAPYVNDVWNHKALLDVVSHTPVETGTLERLRLAGGWRDVVRELKPEPERIYSWWSYRSPDWSAADKGRRLDHVWAHGGIAGAARATHVSREARGWEKASDHAPVTVVFDV